MTSTTGTAGHPDVDELSALTEGLLAPTRAAEVCQHLSDCTDCSETYASLEEIRALLGTFTDSSPMPTDVALRIDAALAAEALLAASAPVPSADASPDSGAEVDALLDSSASSADTSADAGRGTPRHHTRDRVGAHVSRETSPADTPKTSRSRPAGRPKAATGPGRGAQGRGPQKRGRGRRRTFAVSAVFTVVLIGIGSVLIQTLTGGSFWGRSGTPSAHRPTDRHAFSARTLQGEVGTLLKDHPAPHATQPGSTPASPKPSLDMGSKDTPSPQVATPKTATPLDQHETAVEVPDCVRKGIPSSEPALAAEKGTYKGKDAYLVVLPHATDQSKVSAYVVDAACTHKAVAPAGTVLLTGSYPRR